MEENNIEEDIKYIEDVIALAIALPTGEVKIQEEGIEAMQRILSDYKRLQEEFKQVEHKCERLEEREEILNKYKLALFMVIRNSMVMPQGIKLGKTDKEINEMSYETMCSVLTMINYDQAEKFYKEGNGGK